MREPSTDKGAELCIDEGCPHAGIQHVCINRVDSQTTALAPGQIWFPEPGKRAKAREIVRLGDHLGMPHVFWSAFWPSCGHTDISPIRVEGFRKWIRAHGATVKEPNPKSDTAPWKPCHIGSCWRHQSCMYTPCRNRSETDAVAVERAGVWLDTLRNPKPNMWRVDVAGVPVSVNGEVAYEHLRRVNSQLARMKMALHRIAAADAGSSEWHINGIYVGRIAREAMKDD